MARIIARQKSRAATLRTTRERFIGIDRRKGRERKELSFYAKQGCTVKVVESVGSGYLSSHLYSLTSMSTFGDADVFSSQNPMLRTLMIFYIVQGSFLPMIA